MGQNWDWHDSKSSGEIINDEGILSQWEMITSISKNYPYKIINYTDVAKSMKPSFYRPLNTNFAPNTS